MPVPAPVTRRERDVALGALAAVVCLVPLYQPLPWWDLLTHALGTAALVWVARRLGAGWETTLVLLLGVSICIEAAEYQTRLFISGYGDTIVDLTVNFVTWLGLRTGALLGADAWLDLPRDAS